MVLDTPNGEHIHLFSVIEDIRYDMQDAGKRDRHTYAHHYKFSTDITEKVFEFDLTCYSEHTGNIYFVETMSPIRDIEVKEASIYPIYFLKRCCA